MASLQEEAREDAQDVAESLADLAGQIEVRRIFILFVSWY